MGEFKVHRVRFFEYMPSAIRALAFSASTERLALARMDGTVEVFNFADNYYQEKVIPGKESRTIEAICWIGERLFSAGLNGEIIEFDLANLRPRYTVDAYGGPIWALTCNAEGTHIAVGCEDGTVKIFEVLPEWVQFQRSFHRQKGRILSLSWHASGTHVAVGMTDAVCVFSVPSGHVVQRMQVERRLAGPKKLECVVWSVLFLTDFTVVSGDSAGKVQVWDGQTGTLVRTHLVTKWDVLALSASQDESSFVAGTSEGTVVQFQFISPTLQQKEKEWVRTRTFKNHTHDVRCLAEINTAIVSGGMDTQLVVRPLLDKAEFRSSSSALRKLVFPHCSLVTCAKRAGLLLFQFPSHLELWRLGESEGHGKPGDSLPLKRKPEKLLLLKTKGRDHVCSSALSLCAGWLAYSTVTSVRVYQLQCDGNNVSVTKVPKLPKVLSSAHRLCFSTDSSHLFAASTQSAVHVIALGQSECKYVHTFKPTSGSREPVSLMAASTDGRWLATANGNFEVHVYDLCTLKPHCTVPVYGSNTSAMAIHPTTNHLFMVHADQQIFEFSIEEKQYTGWSRKLQKVGLHRLWLERDTPVTHVTFNPRNPHQILLHDMYMFCVIDQSLPLPEKETQFYNQLTLRTLSENERQAKCHAFKICKSFKNLLYVTLLEDHSLVVIERPLVDIASQLPAPVRQKKFAT